MCLLVGAGQRWHSLGAEEGACTASTASRQPPARGMVVRETEIPAEAVTYKGEHSVKASKGPQKPDEAMQFFLPYRVL